MEANEMQEFAEKMKEGGEAALTRISLAISILAVLVAMVTVLGHRSHTEAVLMQSRANDKWTEYGAKKIRDDNLSVTLDLLPLQPSTDPAGVQKKLADYRARHEKWLKDLDELQRTAHEYETEVTHAEAQAARFDLGEALLQIAVVLASITLFTRRNTYFYMGLVLGIGGLLIAASAFLVH